MDPGDTVGPYEVLDAAPAPNGLIRRRGRHARTGEPVELVALRVPAAEAEDVRAAFAATHRALTHITHPSLAKTHEVVIHGDRAVAVRAALLDATLEHVKAPLPPDVVAAIGAALLPAVEAAGSTTRGALSPFDVGLDVRGRPVLAPLARPPALTDRTFAAPECFQGQRPDARAGLYGLGALLYRLATGADPSGRPPARPKALNRAIPEPLDHAILTLMHLDAAQRAKALAELQSLAAAALDLQPYLRDPTALEPRPGASTGQVVYTTGSPRAVRRDDGTAHTSRDVALGGIVVVRPSALDGRDPARLSQLAGWVGVPVDAVRELVLAGMPVVVDTAPTRRAAWARRESLERDTGLEVDVTVGGGWLWLFCSLVFGTASVGSALFGLVLWAVLGGWLVLLLPLAAVVLLFLPSAAGAVTFVARRRDWALANESFRALGAVRQAWARRGLTQTLSRIASLRRQLGSLSLPAAANADLRDALRDIEDRLLRLAEVMDTADRALEQVDLPALEGRLATLDALVARQPETRDQRDRVARTVSDARAIAERRAKLDEEVQEIHAALDEVAAVLGQLADRGDDDGALRRLVDTTQLVKSALVDADAQADQLAALNVRE